ncbi:hypothetical protein BC833DRAFT_393414 [Globomyces pollinis-pini]|nr:hypothetical protein BC833DRAFT_393414 [Globomyces pollinis-pini]
MEILTNKVTFSKEDIVKETQPKTKLIAKYENILVDFEKYSDELMTATKDQKMSALPAMKSIVLLCQKLTDESEKKEDDNLATDEDRRNLVKAKDSVNGTLQKLMELTKSHRMRPSESTSRDIQVTVSKLSLYITDLLEAFENFDHKVKRASVRLSKPVDDELPPMALSELKVYLNDQMDEMAHSIKDLVAAMKQSDSTEDQIIQYINEIADNVDNIVYETQGSIDNSNLKRNVIEDTDDILAKLSEVRLDILDYGDVLVEDLKDQFTKQKITNATYDIAKFAKELMKILY